MNNTIRVTITILSKIVKWANANTELIEKHPLVKEQIEEMKILLQNLEQMVVVTDKPIKNLAQEKKKIKELYIRTIIPLMANLLALGYHNHDNYLIQLANYSKSDIRRMRDETLIAKGKELKEYCDNNQTVVEAIGITTEKTEHMTALRVDYEEKTNTPAVAYAARKMNNAKMKEISSVASNIVHKKFIPLSRGLFEYDHPEQWAELYTIVFRNTDSVRHYDVIGKIIDSVTKKGVSYATIEIEELETERSLRGEKGIFYLRNVPPGTYTAICTQPNYHPKRVVFRKIEKTVLRLTIEMDFNPIDQDSTPNTPQQKRKTTTKQQPKNKTEPEIATNTSTNKQQLKTEISTTAEPPQKKQAEAQREKEKGKSNFSHN